MKNTSKLIIVFVFSLSVIAFLELTARQKKHGRFVIEKANINADNDSLQLLINQYGRLRKTVDSSAAAINVLNDLITTCSININSQNQIQEDMKADKAKIMSKNVRKAKPALTKEDRKNLITADSTINRSKQEVIKIKAKQDEANKQLAACKKIWNTSSQALKLQTQKLNAYTANITGAKSIIFQNIRYHLFVADLDSDELRMHLYNPSDRNRNFYTIEAVKKHLESEKRRPLMITNAGMFISTYAPQGLYVENKSKSFIPLDTEKTHGDGNFYLKPNGVFYLDANNIPHIDTTEQLMSYPEAELRKFKAATQSGPMLVINGRIHKAFMLDSKNKKIRSGVGVVQNNSHKVVFAITMDESNFYDFATFFKDVFECNNALFLDGAISQMYLPEIAPNELGGNFGAMISVSRKKGK